MRNFLSMLILLSLLGCSVKTLPPLKIREDIYSNRLVRKGCSISLPKGFIFYLKKNDIKNVVVRFKSPEVDGMLEKLIYRYPMDLKKLSEYYAERLLEGSHKRTIQKVDMEKRDIFIIRAESVNGKRQIVTALYLEEKKELFILQMVSDKGYFEKKKDVLGKIVAGLKKEDKEKSVRKIHGFKTFASNGRFIWYSDLREKMGFKIFDRKTKYRIAVYKKKPIKKEKKISKTILIGKTKIIVKEIYDSSDKRSWYFETNGLFFKMKTEKGNFKDDMEKKIIKDILLSFQIVL